MPPWSRTIRIDVALACVGFHPTRLELDLSVDPSKGATTAKRAKEFPLLLYALPLYRV